MQFLSFFFAGKKEGWNLDLKQYSSDSQEVRLCQADGEKQAIWDVNVGLQRQQVDYKDCSGTDVERNLSLILKAFWGINWEVDLTWKSNERSPGFFFFQESIQMDLKLKHCYLQHKSVLEYKILVFFCFENWKMSIVLVFCSEKGLMLG